MRACESWGWLGVCSDTCREGEGEGGGGEREGGREGERERVRALVD